MSNWVLSLPWAVVLAGLVIAWTPRIVLSSAPPGAARDGGAVFGTVVGLLINIIVLVLAVAALVR